MLAEGPAASSLRNVSTLKKLQDKHPAGDPEQELQQAAQEEAMAAAAAGPPAGGGAAGVAFTADQVRAAIVDANASSAGGPSTLSNQHVQQCLRDGSPVAAGGWSSLSLIHI